MKVSLRPQVVPAEPRTDGAPAGPPVAPWYPLLAAGALGAATACGLPVEGTHLGPAPGHPTRPVANACTPHPARSDEQAIDLYWLPLGAGASVVRFNGRIYERLHAMAHRRRPAELYHAALEVRGPDGRFIIELTPVAAGEPATRGVVCDGPVGSRWLGRFRLFRYELHCWRDGIIPDVDQAVASPHRLTEDPRLVRELLEAVAGAPPLVWGRDELHTGEMWNSNSVIAWLIARAGIPTGPVHPPSNGRAPGWDAGLIVAERQLDGEVIVAAGDPWQPDGGTNRASTISVSPEEGPRDRVPRPDGAMWGGPPRR